MLLNQTVLMSGADYFGDEFAINARMNCYIPVDVKAAKLEHALIRDALQKAGVTVKQIAPPKDCQDGVYTANWALVRGNSAVLASLPNTRKAEEPYAEQALRDLGKDIIKVSSNLRFSGQGDALPCGNFLFMGTHYRTDLAVHNFVAKALKYEVVSLQTIPKRHLFGYGPTVINKVTGWPDSYYYDIDLALAVLRAPSGGRKGLIAWCPEAFTPESRQKLLAFDGVDKLEVSQAEATKGLALNLVSTGQTVIMSADAPEFQYALESEGFKTVTPHITELRKGGGFIRCTTLTLEN